MPFEKYFQSQSDTTNGDCGKLLGYLYLGSIVLGFIPCIGGLISAVISMASPFTHWRVIGQVKPASNRVTTSAPNNSSTPCPSMATTRSC